MTGLILLALLLLAVIAWGTAYELGYARAARDYLKDSPRWKWALIDAEAERAKEAIK